MPRKTATATAKPAPAPETTPKPKPKATRKTPSKRSKAAAAVPAPEIVPETAVPAKKAKAQPKKTAVKPTDVSAPTPATVEPAPSPASITKAKATELDRKIDSQIKGLGDQLAKAYLAVGAFLKEMRDTGGYAHLGHATWEAYLDSKREYGRTYLSYLYKLGQATGLDAFVTHGMSGTKLIEFAKRTDYPEKIPQLIEATWEEVKDAPVRETAIRLGKFVAEHPEFRRERGKGKGGGRPKLTLRDRLEREWAALGTDAEREEYIKALQAFAREKRPRKNG